MLARSEANINGIGYMTTVLCNLAKKGRYLLLIMNKQTNGMSNYS